MSQETLQDFGIKATPPPGGGLHKIEVKNAEHSSYFDQIKDRYAWYPFSDAHFLANMTMQPMSFNTLFRGRIGWLQSIGYKAPDYGPEALLNDAEEPPLKTFVMTPYAQAQYLMGAFGERGLVIIDALKGSDPELVAAIEGILLPIVPTNLIALGQYLIDVAPRNIDEAGLAPKERSIALAVLATFVESVNTATSYARGLVESSEGEILNRRNKGSGKSALDRHDRYAYTQLARQVPTGETLENSGEVRTNALLEKLVTGLTSGNVSSIVTNDAERESLKNELDTLKAQMAQILASLPKAPTESFELLAVEPSADELKGRLQNQQGKRR